MRKILAFLLASVVFMVLAGCGEKPESAENPEDSSHIDSADYGSVEKETVEVSVAKFNAQVKDNSDSMNPAQDEYLTEHNGQYWYGLLTGVSLVIVPEEFTGDRTKDITEAIYLRITKGGEYEDQAPVYFKRLVKANNDALTDTEVDGLISEAKELAAEEGVANNGKGINVYVVDGEDAYHYCVERIYR